MNKDIEKIINDGIYAPSGENCQPWRFVIDNNIVFLYNRPEADQSLYNSEQKGSYVAHGALVETMSISAKEHGYTIDVDLFPEASDVDLVAKLSLHKVESQNQSLYRHIKNRCTNRKEYTGKKLSSEQKKELVESINGFQYGSVALVDDESTLQTLGAALAVNEKVLFENKYIHDFFYDHVFWDKKDETKAGGFYIETLEFLPHQLKGVKLFKSWPVLSLLNRFLKVSTMISKENGEKYTKSGTFVAIVANGTKKEDYINAGRATARVWLTATSLGLAVHPCNGVTYFMEQINDNGGKEFSDIHKTLIKGAHSTILQTFNVKNTVIPMLFRVGFADAPSARSARLPAVIEVRGQ
jgi:hypothetical protein